MEIDIGKRVAILSTCSLIGQLDRIRTRPRLERL